MVSTDRDWRKWGRDDPYFGVLADDRFAASNVDAHRDAFFASGQGFVTEVLRRYEQHFGSLRRARALDHGCGVGRLTLPLARQFASVVALDVAPDMIAEAERNARRAGVNNVRFALADDRLLNARDKYDFVNSHLVLQHIPVRRGLPILERLLDCVNRGGGFHFNVSFRTETPMWRLLYWASANIPGVKTWQNVCAGRRWNLPAMQMNDYPLQRIIAQLASRGVTEYLVTTEKHPRFVTCSFLGKLPA
jgi:SAM-dependent methyltransferase